MEHEPYLQIAWTDPVSGRRGYLVIDKLIRGACGGGLRMREGCTLAEVRGLAQVMTLKEAISFVEGDQYIPMGGAKGGIDCDPYDPEAREVLERYLNAMRPLLACYWSTGEDFGVRQDVLDEIFPRLGLNSSVHAATRLAPDPDTALQRIEDAFAVTEDGIGLSELVGGYGVARATVEALEHLGSRVSGARVIVQGFGSMGGATARYLSRDGAKVVGIADVHGLVANEDGLDVERLLLTRDQHGAVDRNMLRPEDHEMPRDAWLDMPCEVFVPAATSYVLTPENCDRLQAQLVVEAANLATVPEAEAALASRGVWVIPDFVANLATNAWWWWMLFGDIDPTTGSSFEKIDSTLRGLLAEILTRATEENLTPRVAAEALAKDRSEQLSKLYPFSPSVK